MHTRLAITGMGVVTTLGASPGALWAALDAGRSGIGRWRDMDPRIYSKIGGDLSGFDAMAHLASQPAPLRERAAVVLRDNPRGTQLAACVIADAARDAALDLDPVRIGNVLGGHDLHARYQHDNALVHAEEPEYIDPLFGVLAFDTDAATAAGEVVGLMGPTFTVGGACATGNTALLAGIDLLAAGRCDAVVVSAVALTPSPVILQGWALIDAISYRSFNETPERASRPFDRRREGFVPAEGAAAVVIEPLSAALARGATVHAEIFGIAATSAGTRHTRPDLGAQVRCARAALADARMRPEEIDYVNAHGTSTPVGDKVEVAALEEVLGAHARAIPVNSTKSMLGHALQAASLIELVATVEQMRHGRVHPTLNLDDPDPELTLDFVPHRSRPHEIRAAMSNAFGFGGLNSCVVLGSPR
jgi:3-oxoacyl-(acyl-carrier-protein) synthase